MKGMIMADDETKQFINVLNEAKNIAFLLSGEPSLDALVSARALQAIVSGKGGNGVIVSGSTTIPQTLFFSQPVSVQKTFGGADQLVVKISNANAKPGELRYESEPDGLVIYLKAKEGIFSASDVTVIPASGKLDAIVTLGVSNLDQLGKIYTEHTEVFFSTPIYNIDNNPANEYYGTVNLVNVKAGSISELVFDIAEGIPDSFDNDLVSTGLLAGVIEQTQSFRDPKTTPSTLSKAARLITSGARQQDIIQHLFKTKPFATLQLWGRAMARLVASLSAIGSWATA